MSNTDDAMINRLIDSIVTQVDLLFNELVAIDHDPAECSCEECIYWKRLAMASKRIRPCTDPYNR